MYKYILNYEKWINEKIEKNDVGCFLLTYHDKQIKWIQHERLIHLIVTLFTAFLFLLSTIAIIFVRLILVDLIFCTLIIITIFYIIHYYRLENAVQRWYEISNNIFKNKHNL